MTIDTAQFQNQQLSVHIFRDDTECVRFNLNILIFNKEALCYFCGYCFTYIIFQVVYNQMKRTPPTRGVFSNTCRHLWAALCLLCYKFFDNSIPFFPYKY